ncbi:MFS transporter [Flagellimonas sp.]|uniref:MFS transporter n=1 Tax=Flagellimonas sp. TaxID=2058762 RepID=UPI003B504EC5
MKERLKTIKTIHVGFCIGITLIYFILGDLHTLDFIRIQEMDSSSMIYLLIPISAIFLGNMLYRQQLKNVGRGLKMEEKIGAYQTASLIRWAILEGAAFLILFLKKELLLIGLFLILYMIFLKPSEEGMKRDFMIFGK